MKLKWITNKTISITNGGRLYKFTVNCTKKNTVDLITQIMTFLESMISMDLTWTGNSQLREEACQKTKKTL